MENLVLFSIVIILGIGVFSQWLAWRIQWPSIVIMSIAGLLIGPVFGLMNPEIALGELYSPLISLAVAIILFEGSSNLDVREIRSVSKSVFRIVTVSAFIAWILGSLAAHYIAGLSWEIAFIIGGLFVVTGPTVIIPLLRNAKLKARTAAVLKWEGIIVDPAGPLLALFAYEVVKVMTHDELSMNYLFKFFGAALLAAIIGYVLGMGISLLAKKGLFPEYLKSPIILVFVLVCFAGAEVIMSETGMLSVTVMGLTVARTKKYVPSIGNISHFVDNISVMLTSTVFILLTASLPRETIAQIFTWPIIGFVFAMLFVVRPLSIWLPTIGTELTRAERTLIGWIAPRGIVALTVSGYFASMLIKDGYEGASILTTLTFALVFITVVVHGFSLGPLAKKLGLASNDPPGVLIVGASSFSIAVANYLREMGTPVLLADRSGGRLHMAKNKGLQVYKGEVLSEHARFSVDFTPYETILAMTSDASYNALVTQSFAPEFGFTNTFTIPATAYQHTSEKEPDTTLKPHLLFDEEATFPELNRKVNTTYVLETAKMNVKGTVSSESLGDDVTPIFIKKKNNTIVFVTIGEKFTLDEEDRLVVLKPNVIEENDDGKGTLSLK